jgi:hypothetical protein
MAQNFIDLLGVHVKLADEDGDHPGVVLDRRLLGLDGARDRLAAADRLPEVGARDLQPPDPSDLRRAFAWAKVLTGRATAINAARPPGVGFAGGLLPRRSLRRRARTRRRGRV